MCVCGQLDNLHLHAAHHNFSLQQQHPVIMNLIVLTSGQEKTEKGPNPPPKKGDSTECLCGSTIQEGIDAVAAKERSHRQG